MNKEEAKRSMLPAPKDDYVPALVYRIEKKQSTGTKELGTIAKALDAIHKGMETFLGMLTRSEEKNQQISERLYELKCAIEAGNYDQEELEDILENLDERIFDESVYTEKCGKGAMRMTDSTKLDHLGKLTSAAAKIAQTKQKMSPDEYTPTSVVVDKAQETIDMMRKILNENLGRQQAELVMDGFMIKAVKIWDDL